MTKRTKSEPSSASRRILSLNCRSRSRSHSESLVAAHLRTYIIGISGGVDSLMAGLLAQAAVKELRETGYQAEFAVVRPRFGQKPDEHETLRKTGSS